MEDRQCFPFGEAKISPRGADEDVNPGWVGVVAGGLLPPHLPGVAACGGVNTYLGERYRRIRRRRGKGPPILRHLPDGSFTSLIGGVQVRVITAQVTVTCHDGTRYGGCYTAVLSKEDALRLISGR